MTGIQAGWPWSYSSISGRSRRDFTFLHSVRTGCGALSVGVKPLVCVSVLSSSPAGAEVRNKRNCTSSSLRMLSWRIWEQHYLYYYRNIRLWGVSCQSRVCVLRPMIELCYYICMQSSFHYVLLVKQEMVDCSTLWAVQLSAKV